MTTGESDNPRDFLELLRIVPDEWFSTRDLEPEVLVEQIYRGLQEWVDVLYLHLSAFPTEILADLLPDQITLYWFYDVVGNTGLYRLDDIVARRFGSDHDNGGFGIFIH